MQSVESSWYNHAMNRGTIWMNMCWMHSMENIGKQSPRETTTCHTEFVKTPSTRSSTRPNQDWSEVQPIQDIIIIIIIIAGRTKFKPLHGSVWNFDTNKFDSWSDLSLKMSAWRYAGIPNQMTCRTPHDTHPVPDTMAFRVDRWSLFDQSQPCWNRSIWPVCLPKFPEKHHWKPWECTLQCANAAEKKSTLHALPSCLNSKLLGPKSNFLLFKSPYHQFFHVLKRGEYLFSVSQDLVVADLESSVLLGRSYHGF